MDSVSIVIPAHQAKRQGVKSLVAGDALTAFQACKGLFTSFVTMTIPTAHAHKHFHPETKSKVVPKKNSPGPPRRRDMGYVNVYAWPAVDHIIVSAFRSSKYTHFLAFT